MSKKLDNEIHQTRIKFETKSLKYNQNDVLKLTCIKQLRDKNV